MEELLVYLALLAAVWGISLIGLKRLADEANGADEDLRDSANVAIMALHLLAGAAAAAGAGYSVVETSGGILLGIMLFLIPFAVVGIMYGSKTPNESNKRPLMKWFIVATVVLYATWLLGLAFGCNWMSLIEVPG